MTPIRETIARAISPYYWAAAGTPRDTRSKKVHRDRSLFAADRVLRALDEAGCVVVRKEPMPEAVAAWWRVKNGFHFHGEPPPTDTSDYAAYRAMIAAAVVE